LAEVRKEKIPAAERLAPALASWGLGKIAPHELQHRYRETLFGHSLFEKLQFSVVQLGFE
jgi:hypothetical protein